MQKQPADIHPVPHKPRQAYERCIDRQIPEKADGQASGKALACQEDGELLRPGAGQAPAPQRAGLIPPQKAEEKKQPSQIEHGRIQHARRKIP